MKWRVPTCSTASAVRKERAKQVQKTVATEPALHVTDKGQRVPLDFGKLQALIESACAGLGADVKADPVLAETRRNLYDGVPIDEVHKAAILAARTLIEKDPGYTRATARLLLHTIRREILGEDLLHEQMHDRYAEYFPRFHQEGCAGRTARREAAAVRPGQAGALR